MFNTSLFHVFVGLVFEWVAKNIFEKKLYPINYFCSPGPCGMLPFQQYLMILEIYQVKYCKTPFSYVTVKLARAKLPAKAAGKLIRR